MRYICIEKQLIDYNGSNKFEVLMVYGDGMTLIGENGNSLFYTNEELNRWFITEIEYRKIKIQKIYDS